MNLKSFIVTLTQSFGWHPSRCVTFSSFILSLIDQRNVQHHALCHCLKNTESTLKSQLERVRRFFVGQVFNYDLLAKNMVLQMFKGIPKMDLILDRTNWKLGKKNINYLVLAARVGAITFPLFWSLLDHQECSNANSRIQLLKKFKTVSGLDKIKSFTADREFVGKEWILYLAQEEIPFLSA